MGAPIRNPTTFAVVRGALVVSLHAASAYTIDKLQVPSAGMSQPITTTVILPQGLQVGVESAAGRLFAAWL